MKRRGFLKLVASAAMAAVAYLRGRHDERFVCGSFKDAFTYAPPTGDASNVLYGQRLILNGQPFFIIPEGTVKWFNSYHDRISFRRVSAPDIVFNSPGYEEQSHAT